MCVCVCDCCIHVVVHKITVFGVGCDCCSIQLCDCSVHIAGMVGPQNLQKANFEPPPPLKKNNFESETNQEPLTHRFAEHLAHL